MTSDLALLLRIQQACHEIIDHAGSSEAEFHRTRLRQVAVMYNLIVVGEAAKRISPRLSDQARGSLPAAAKMRDRLAHELFEIRIEAIWQTATGAVPVLLGHVDSFLTAQRNGSN